MRSNNEQDGEDKYCRRNHVSLSRNTSGSGDVYILGERVDTAGVEVSNDEVIEAKSKRQQSSSKDAGEQQREGNPPENLRW